MSKKQLTALFSVSLSGYVVGNGLLPLLPLYAIQIGAGPALVGYYLSFSYFALAIGSLVAGWLSDKFQRRKATIIACVLVSIPVIWLMGRVISVWQLVALTATVWFLGGIGLAMTNILTGLFAEETERGKIFGILSLTAGLGALIGGITAGPVADRWGYPTMFAIFSLFYVLSLIAALLLEDKVVGRVHNRASSSAKKKPWLGVRYLLFLSASLAAGIAVFVGRMGTSLAMGGLGYVLAAISSTGAIGGAFTLPLPPLLGWLSDKMSRKRILIVCYLIGSVGLLVLAFSVSLWHFWISAIFISVLSYVGIGVGSALVTDLIPQESLGRGLSLYGAVTWVGGIIGFAVTGYSIQHLGLYTTFIIGAFLPLLAVLLLIPIRQTELGNESAIQLK